MSVRSQVVLFASGALLLGGLAAWLVYNLHTPSGRSDDASRVAPGPAAPPIPAPVEAPPAIAPPPTAGPPDMEPPRVAPRTTPYSPGELREMQAQMDQHREEVTRLVQDMHTQLAAGRSPRALLSTVQAAKARYRALPSSEAVSIALEQLDELELQLRLRVRSQDIQQGVPLPN